MKTRTFRAIDGRIVRFSESDDQKAERELLNMAAVVMPILTILVFAMAAGVL